MGQREACRAGREQGLFHYVIFAVAKPDDGTTCLDFWLAVFARGGAEA